MSGVNPINPTLGFPCPLTLKCTVTGEEVVYSDPDYIRDRIERAGGLDSLLKTYVSKAGKRQLREQGGQKPDLRPSRTWGGKPIISQPVEPSATVSSAPEGRVTHLFLNQDSDGFCWIGRTDSPRQSEEQKPIMVHDFRKNKSEPFNAKGFSSSTVKELQSLGVVLTR
jgi:hypothetical protein